MSTASAPRPTYNAPREKWTVLVDCAREDKAMHLSTKDKLLVYQ